MGKRYYCDYCERSFADGAENRKKHLASMHHQKLRKAHYDMFKDATTILEENRLKKPCIKFQNNGECEYGSNCKYSHLTPLDIQQLEEEARLVKAGPPPVEPNIEAKIDAWIESISKMKENSATSLNVCKPILPTVLVGIPDLPPSVIPPVVVDAYNAPEKNEQIWG